MSLSDKQNGRYASTDLITNILLLVLFTALFSWTFELFRPKLTDKISSINFSIKKREPVIEPTPKPSTVVNGRDKFIVYRVENDTERAIYTGSIYADLQIEAWRHFIIYPNKNEIKIENTDDYTVQTLVDKQTINSFLEESVNDDIANRIQLTQLTIVDNILYISYGGYFIEGMTLWVDLQNKEEINLLARVTDPKVTKIADKYWIRGGGGDSCQAVTELLELDTKTPQIKSRFVIESTCSESTFVTGWSKKKAAFVAVKQNETGYTGLEYIYQNGNRVSIANTQDSTFPNDITTMLFDSDANVVYFASNTNLYYFSINREQLINVGTFKTQYENIKLTDVILSEQLCADTYPNGIVTLDKTTAEEMGNTACRSLNATENSTEQGIQRVVKKLEFVKEFKNYNYRII